MSVVCAETVAPPTQEANSPTWAAPSKRSGSTLVYPATVSADATPAPQGPFPSGPPPSPVGSRGRAA